MRTLTKKVKSRTREWPTVKAPPRLRWTKVPGSEDTLECSKKDRFRACMFKADGADYWAYIIETGDGMSSVSGVGHSKKDVRLWVDGKLKQMLPEWRSYETYLNTRASASWRSKN